MANFPRDRFDDLPPDPARIGAHRAATRRGRGWIRFAWAALATGLLVLVGAIGVSVAGGRPLIDLPGTGSSPTGIAPTSSAPAPPTAVTDPKSVDPALGLTITVLNASPTDGRATAAATVLRAAGWPVGTVNAASARDLTRSVVYYTDTRFAGIALGLTERLGTRVTAEQSQVYQGAPVTVVIGSDWAPPTG